MNFNLRRILYILTACCIIVFVLTGCHQSDTTLSQTTIAAEELFSDRDKNADYDESAAQLITLADNASESNASAVAISGNTLTISKEGIYLLSGTLHNGQIVVDASESDKVQLVLDNVSITNSNGAAIYVKSADKVFITLKEDTESRISNTETLTDNEDTDIDGVIFSKEDLTFNGNGTLVIASSNGNGIVSKDDLKITGGTYVITTSGKGMEANDSIRIGGGDITVTAEDDSIHSDGDVYITDGDLTLSSGDDGIHADANNVIYGGTIDIIRCKEAIEGTTVTVSGGSITAKASDDGINAASPKDKTAQTNPMSEFETDENALITISGGTIYLDCDGDGMDSNGNIVMTGGEVYVAGPTGKGNGALDYNGSFTITGGTLLAVGSADMAMNVSEAKQGAILITFSNYYSGVVKVTDSEGNELLAYQLDKLFNSIVISSPKLQTGKTYTISVDDTYQTVTLDDYIFGNGTGMGMMQRGK